MNDTVQGKHKKTASDHYLYRESMFGFLTQARGSAKFWTYATTEEEFAMAS